MAQADQTGGPRRFSFNCDTDGHWTLDGPQARAARDFEDLASALAFARRDSRAAAATLELRVAGLYVCVHQAKGWPQRICAPSRAA